MIDTHMESQFISKRPPSVKKCDPLSEHMLCQKSHII